MKRKVFKGIKEWIETNARTLELTRFQYLFERGSKEAYYKELMKYQNKDGGFGYGLEPDSTNPYSTPIQTWTAFELFQELKLPKNDPMVKNAITYLTQTPFFENGYWYATIPSNDQYPHAPWWSHSEDEKIWGYNPTAAIAGFIYTHSLKEANKLFAKEIIQRAINDFLKGQFDEMHELRNFIELYEHIKDIPLFGSLKEFGERLEKAMLANVEKDESKWFTSYCVRPSQYIYEKNMVGYTLLRDYIQKEISMLPDHLDSDGVWPITWEWGQFPEEFAKAKQIWKGILAIRYLKIDKEL